jgi:hypothetical protein
MTMQVADVEDTTSQYREGADKRGNVRPTCLVSPQRMSS